MSNAAIDLRISRDSSAFLKQCRGSILNSPEAVAHRVIVGDYNGSPAREVLYTSEQWETMKSGAELEPAGV